MGKRRILSGKQVRAILADHGFTQVRQRGSHIIMQRRIAHSTITVPIPNHRELAPGTLSSIVRQSHLPRAAFEV